jgi:hypothetical protein
LPDGAQGSAVVCIKLLWGYVIPWVGNLMKEEPCTFNEIFSIVILVPISSETLAILTEVLHDIPQSLQAHAIIVLLFGYDLFLPNHFQFIYDPTIQHYIVYVLTGHKITHTHAQKRI